MINFIETDTKWRPLHKQLFQDDFLGDKLFILTPISKNFDLWSHIDMEASVAHTMTWCSSSTKASFEQMTSILKHATQLALTSQILIDLSRCWLIERKWLKYVVPFMQLLLIQSNDCVIFDIIKNRLLAAINRLVLCHFTSLTSTILYTLVLWWNIWCMDSLAPKVVTADIFNCFSSINTFVFCLKFDLSLFLRAQLLIILHSFKWWFGAVQATTHFLNQHEYVSQPQWVKSQAGKHFTRIFVSSNLCICTDIWMLGPSDLDDYKLWLL